MHRINRSIIAGLALVAVAVPSAAAQAVGGGPNPDQQAAPAAQAVGGGPNPDQQAVVSSAAPYALPSNFHTDASSGSYLSGQAGPPASSVAQPSSGCQWGDAG